MTLLLHLSGIGSAILASWLWYLASRRRLRRISRAEVLDAADLDRTVTTINRNSLLIGRAALAAAASAASVAARFAADIIASL